MYSAIAIVVLYVLGAIATIQCLMHSGHWREAKSDKGFMAVIAIFICFWPVFIIFVSVLVVRGVIPKKVGVPNED